MFQVNISDIMIYVLVLFCSSPLHIVAVTTFFLTFPGCPVIPHMQLTEHPQLNISCILRVIIKVQKPASYTLTVLLHSY
jgi:hypothetical protein